MKKHRNTKNRMAMELPEAMREWLDGQARAQSAETQTPVNRSAVIRCLIWRAMAEQQQPPTQQ